MKELYSAAGTLVFGEEKNSLILLAKRSLSAFFYPGAYVMPGGLVSEDDKRAAERLVDMGIGSDDERFHGIHELAYRVTFLREFFEETGILLTKGLNLRLTRDEIIYFRQKLVRREVSFLGVLKVLGVPLSDVPIMELQYAGSRITPPFSSLKYVTRYYVYVVDKQPMITPNFQEHEEITWWHPSELLQRYEKMEVVIPPPALQQLQYLKIHDVKKATELLISHDNAPFGVSVPIEMTPNVEVIPLYSQTLPPARTTNMSVLGGKEYVLIDPGARKEEWGHEQALIKRLQNEGRVCQAIILTHAHKDHYEGLPGIVEETRAPVFAHEYTKNALNNVVHVNSVLHDGEKIPVVDKHGTRYYLEVLHTPGHTKGSISIYDPIRAVLSVGDLMSGLGTTIINPPDGDLREYLDSLRRIKRLPLRMIIPGHGPLIMKPKKKIQEYLDHRLERHEAIRTMLKKRPKDIMELVKLVYTDVKEKYYPLAARSLLAHLLFLHEEGELDKAELDELLQGYMLDFDVHREKFVLKET